MARPLRIDFEGAYHHVMARIINGSFWLKSNKIKKLFYDTLLLTSLKFDTKIIAYSIMDNHFHIVLQTNKTSISKFMQILLSSFAMKYNHMQNRKGHLFENRFKSFLIEKEEYLLTVIKYILENPVRSGIVTSVEEYSWSSYNKYFQIDEHPMHNIGTSEIVNIFNSKEAFYDYMGLEKSNNFLLRLPKCVNRVQLYGSKAYLEKIITLYIKEKRNSSRKISKIPESIILKFIEKKYKINKEYLLMPGGQRDKLKPRRIFVYFNRKYLHLYLKEIGKRVGVCSSTVSSMIQKTLRQILDIRAIEIEFLEVLHQENFLL